MKNCFSFSFFWSKRDEDELRQRRGCNNTSELYLHLISVLSVQFVQFGLFSFGVGEGRGGTTSWVQRSRLGQVMGGAIGKRFFSQTERDNSTRKEGWKGIEKEREGWVVMRKPSTI